MIFAVAFHKNQYNIECMYEMGRVSIHVKTWANAATRKKEGRKQHQHASHLGRVHQSQRLPRPGANDGGEQPIVPVRPEAGRVRQAQQLHRRVDQADSEAPDPPAAAIAAAGGDGPDLVRHGPDGAVPGVGIAGRQLQDDVERDDGVVPVVRVARVGQRREEGEERPGVGLPGRLVGTDAHRAGEAAGRAGDLHQVGPVELRHEAVAGNPRGIERRDVGAAQHDPVASGIEEARGQQPRRRGDVAG